MLDGHTGSFFPVDNEKVSLFKALQNMISIPSELVLPNTENNLYSSGRF